MKAPRKPAARKAAAGRPRPATTKTTKTTKTRRARTRHIASLEVEEIESLRAELDKLSSAQPPRWNAHPDDVRRSVGKLVLTLVEFIRQLLERQAIRRMEAGTLTPEETEAVGLALMRLEETVRYVGAQFGLAPEDLNLDLGPAGKLM
jgi:regulator of sirC expression with transglutaminase-like and TPR domain